MDAATKRISMILDSISADQDGDDAKDDIMPSYVFNRASRSFFGSLVGSRRRRRVSNTNNNNGASQPLPNGTSLAPDSSGGSNNNCNSLSRYGLDIATLDPQSDLPAPVSDLLYFLKSERKCLRNNDDIFQVRTSSIDVKTAAIVKAYNEERLFRVDNIGVDKRDNIAAGFGAVVAYFQAMPRPLIPFAFMNFVLSQDWYRLASQDDVTALRDDFVERLPLVNYRILRKLISTLRQMSIWAFEKQNEEAPVWLVSTFRRHWTFYSIDRPTNNAIYVASFVALTVFRSGLGRFSPDNESLFHFRSSCFLAQLMLNFNALFVPKRKKVSLPASLTATSSDKCGRNEVGYENEQADLRLQQISALSAHLGRIMELSNQMTAIGDDAVNRICSAASVRKRADAVAVKLDALGIDILANATSVERSTELITVYLDKHNLFSCQVSLAKLQSLLFNIRLDTSDYKTASTNLNLRDYIALIVSFEGAICRLTARRFLETRDLLAERLANSAGECFDDADSVELIFEPAASVLRHNNPSPVFLSPSSLRKADRAELACQNNNGDHESIINKSEEVSLLMGDSAVVISNNNSHLNSSNGSNNNTPRDCFRKTPSPSSDVDDDFYQTEEIIEITKRFTIYETIPDHQKTTSDALKPCEIDSDSSFAERTPTPETPMIGSGRVPNRYQNGGGKTMEGGDMTAIIIENHHIKSSNDEAESKSEETVTSGIVSSRQSSSGEPAQILSPRRQFTLDEDKINAVINNSSRPQSSASSVSVVNNGNNRIQIPGLHLGALHRGEASPMPVSRVQHQRQSAIAVVSSSPRTSSRTSFCSSNSGSSGTAASSQINQRPPYQRYSYMPAFESRSATVQRKFQPSLETNV